MAVPASNATALRLPAILAQTAERLTATSVDVASFMALLWVAGTFHLRPAHAAKLIAGWCEPEPRRSSTSGPVCSPGDSGV
jgi:hypothetical protein